MYPSASSPLSVSFFVNHPTPYPAINTLLRELRSGARAILGEGWIGMYLTGSLASGDFDPQRSDIDFVIATTGEFSAAEVQALEAMHSRLSAGGSIWARRLEGSYIPQGALRRYNPAAALYPSVQVGGTFGIDGQGIDGILQRFLLREQGIALSGPPPRNLIDPVSADDLRMASRGILLEWWQPQLHDPHRMFVREYQAYAVLTMCRILYTIQHGTLVSKPKAARWAREILGEKWAGLIDRALAWQPDDGVDDLQETLDFIRFTIKNTSLFPTLSVGEIVVVG